MDDLVPDIRRLQANDAKLVATVKEQSLLQNNPYSTTPDCLILHRGRIFVPDNDDVQLRILRTRHDHPLAGHPGIAKTVEIIRRDFYWPKMRKFVDRYVSHCQECVRNKAHRHKPYGLLKPLPIAERPWSSISIDYIEQLPISNGHDSILVIVDRLTKMAIFVPAKTTDRAPDLAKQFLQHVVSKHGVPIDLVSDRGAKFTSEFWASLSKALGIKQNLSTAYRPQSDGQMERVNQALEQYIRLYVNYNQVDWTTLLPLAEFAYNNTPHSTTKVSPFFANYGYNPSFDITTTLARSGTAKEVARNLADLHQYLRHEIAKSNDRYKKFADRHRLPAPNYSINDQVWLSTKNLRTTRPSRKLSERRLGPLRIIKIVSPQAVQLELPTALRNIHPVFHVSLLEPAKQDDIPGRQHEPPPPVEIEDELEWEVETILDSRIRRDRLEYLDKWAGIVH
jgi:transposase InsO family protein